MATYFHTLGGNQHVRIIWDQELLLTPLPPLQLLLRPLISCRTAGQGIDRQEVIVSPDFDILLIAFNQSS